jgi:probable rRNA maturation factor
VAILIDNRQRRRVPVRALRRAAELTIERRRVDPERELSLVFVDDAEMQRLNRQYRGRDCPTDVLSFPQENSGTDAESLLGDVVVSVDTAVRQAQEAGHALARELALLTVHGTLHLLGLQDETPGGRRWMQQQAAAVLRAWEEEASR